ncbi:MAG TPA: 3',5'-cyclic-nucleotide phosphodiesterase [Actinomycetota bacterium]|nr:3',5'-cyclic-nucleotide phosphodiesterase [Actinomycetota bacterium]
MKLQVLGCSGGIGGNLRTTSFLVDEDILIDAGTGVGSLSLSEMSKVDHVFVTHSHLDHVACIPFLVDSVGYLRDRPLTVHATAETLQILREHIFNWHVWPDFTTIPNTRRPYLRYEAFEIEKPLVLDGRFITAIRANHVVPAVGFHLDSGKSSLIFSGDTTRNPSLWEYLNCLENLRYLIIETAFPDKERELAIASKHLCPSMLAEELAKLHRAAEILITHLKPGESELTMQEIHARVGRFRPRMLLHGETFDF